MWIPDTNNRTPELVKERTIAGRVYRVEFCPWRANWCYRVVCEGQTVADELKLGECWDWLRAEESRHASAA